MTLIEIAEDTTLEAVKEATEAEFVVAKDLKSF
jgi:acyl CoA:acetate/3-ketoacid CoA transferase beta subunit